MSSGPSRFSLENSRAVFISTLSPGLLYGGFQWTLAFLQAVSKIHNGRVVYVGAPFSASYPGGVALESSTEVEKRSSARLVGDFLRYGYYDRVACSDVVRQIIAKEKAAGPCVVYINGERGGYLAKFVKSCGLPCVMLYIDYGPEYVKAHAAAWNLKQMVHAWMGCRSGIAGYRNATVRLFLTEEDRLSYRRLVRRDDLDEASFGRMYFGCREWSSASTSNRQVSREKPLLSINADLSRRENAAGILPFLSDVWPAINKAFPQAELVLAGKKPLDAIRVEAERHPKVRLIGSPTTAELDDLLRRTTVSIATSVGGSGIKVRIAEALHYGVPALSTPHCTRGYESLSLDVLKVYRNAAEAVSHVGAFLQKNPEILTRRCIEEYEKHLGFETGVRKLKTVLQTVLVNHPSDS